MKTASVAPMTESAPFMPHAQGTRAESFTVIRRMPAGSGMPNSTPAGVISRTVRRMRTAWLALIVERMIGGSATMARIATPTTPSSDELHRAQQPRVGDATADKAADARTEKY